MAVPTKGEVFAKLLDHLREAQSCASTMAHLYRADSGGIAFQMAKGWLLIEDLINKMCHRITIMGQGKLH